MLLPSALQRLNADERIESLVVTNTIPVPADPAYAKVKVLSIAPLLADIIERIYHGASISEQLLLT